MKVLWLTPWMRSLARVHVEHLIAEGDDVMMITTDQHPESDQPRPYERVVDARFKRPSTWAPFVDTLRAARAFAPDVVVTELVRDPRWMALGASAPRVQLIHDDKPHDLSERPPAWERAVFDRWGASSTATAVFSEHVADAVRRGDVPGTGGKVHVLPLTSDLDEHRVPPIAQSADRRDMVLVGRINPYKNLDVVLEAWNRHVHGPGWRGDRLVIIGKGDVTADLPPHTRHQNTPFRYDDELGVISRAKASLVHYRRATQSGVQTLSMQLGVPTIVSDQGALGEFQTDGDPVIGVDDVDGLVRELDRLADPETAFLRGSAAREQYEKRYHATVVGSQLHRLLAEVAGVEQRAPDPVQFGVPRGDVEV